MRCVVCHGDFEYIHLRNVGGKAYCVQCYASQKLRATTPTGTAAGQPAARSGSAAIEAPAISGSWAKHIGFVILGLFAVAVIAFSLQMTFRWNLSPIMQAVGLEEPLNTSPASTPAASSAFSAADALVPPIHVVGDDQHILTFSEWKRDALGIVGVMTCPAPTMIESIKFTAKRNGIVIDRGDVTIIGGEIRKNETVQVRMNIGDLFEKDRSGYDVTIEVQE